MFLEAFPFAIAPGMRVYSSKVKDIITKIKCIDCLPPHLHLTTPHL